jgi:hypothetical protein
MFVNGLGQNVQSLEMTAHRCFLPSVGSFGQNGFRGKFLKKINQSETRVACGGHVCKRIGTK